MASIVMAKEHYDFIENVKKINKCLTSCVSNFVEIGYRLDEIKNANSFELIGYKTFEEFCTTEFNLGSTSVKNYIAVAKRFGDSKTKQLNEKFKKYRLSQLTELLPVSDDSIDNYSPEMTTKKIRTIKLISQSTDYKEKITGWIKLYIEEHKEEIKQYIKLRIDYRSYSISLYSENSQYDSFIYIFFNEGYYSFNNDKIYDLTLENFQKIFESKFMKLVEAEHKEIKKIKEEKEKKKIEDENKRIASLPENKEGLSEEKRRILKDKRLEEESISKLKEELSKVSKKSDYNFFTYLSNYDYTFTFELFARFNKIQYQNYPLCYKPKSFISGMNYIGLINGLTHLRFYHDHVDLYNNATKEFETVISREKLIQVIGNSIFYGKECFTNLLNLNIDNKEFDKPLFKVDLEETIEDLKNKRFGF